MAALRNALLLVLGSYAASVQGANVTVLSYEFPGGALTPTTQVGATGSAIAAFGPTYIAPEEDAPNSIAIHFVTPTVNTANYIELTVTPTSAAGFNVLQISAAKGGSSNPRGFVVRSSLDGYTADLMAVTLTTIAPSWVVYTVPLGTAFMGLGSPVTFRMYGFAPNPGNSVDPNQISFIYASPATVGM